MSTEKYSAAFYMNEIQM